MQTNESICPVVVVNYFIDDEVMDFISSQLSKQVSISQQIIVVNNGSQDPEKLENFCRKMNVILIDAGKNLGYLGAFNLAVEHQLRQSVFPHLMILSNSDIRFSDPEVLHKIQLKYKGTDYGIIGISVISSRTRHDQNPMYTAPLSLNKLKRLRFVYSYQVVYIMYQLLSIIRNSLKPKPKTTWTSEQRREVYAVHGSFIIFSKRFLELAGEAMKQSPFLFGEEIFIAELCRRYGLKILFDPSLRIYHDEHQTTGLFKSRSRLKMLKDSIGQHMELFRTNKAS